MNESQRICPPDNWDKVLGDPEPRAIRWARRSLAREFNDPDWSKWHYTEGNGVFTACSRPVLLCTVDGSPQESGLSKVECLACLKAMAKVSVQPVSAAEEA